MNIYTYEECLKLLNHCEKEKRIEAVARLKELAVKGAIEIKKKDGYTNNHIHSKYSFSPYYPAKAAWLAYAEGLSTAGLVDHESTAGAGEFLEAATILGLPVSCGMEVRVDMRGTALERYRLNNPDQAGNAYVTLQGIAHDKLGYVNDSLFPYRKARCERTRKMAEEIAKLLARWGIDYSFEQDVLKVSRYEDGGTITERHMLYALVLKLIAMKGKGPQLVGYLAREWGLAIPEKTETLLAQPDNPHYEYDMLGLLKASFLDKVYIKADRECLRVADFIRMSEETGAIPAYCYLGDQKASVTGDKKPMEFEDRDLEFIIVSLKEMGFRAIEYMPTRNTNEQITALRKLCEKHGMFEICGEDINQPGQKFICEKMKEPLFAGAYENSFALIGHELSTSRGDPGMFSRENASLPMRERVMKFAAIAGGGTVWK
jgi:hypothetical protein